MSNWILKWNDGNLAILCSKCSKIIKTGKDFTPEELNAVENSISLSPYYCENCKVTFKVYTSRYNEKRYFELQSNGDYLIYGKSEFMRHFGIDELQSIDYEGGPFITVGTNLKEFGLQGIVIKIIKDYTSHYPNCYRLIVNDRTRI